MLFEEQWSNSGNLNFSEFFSRDMNVVRSIVYNMKENVAHDIMIGLTHLIFISIMAVSPL